MSMVKILVSIPEELKDRADATIPARQRSATICELIRTEVEKREMALYKCALDLENDRSLNEEMSDWDITVGDGDVSNESW